MSIEKPIPPLGRGDKVSVWRKKEARFRWGKVIKAERRTIRVKMFKTDEVLNIPESRVTHRCVVKGCTNPAKGGKRGEQCAKCRAESVAFRPTGRMDEYVPGSNDESPINGNGQHRITWNENQTHFNFVARDKRLKLREDQNKAKANVTFYGWYRRTKIGGPEGTPAHSMDVFAKRWLDDGTEADVSVDTVTYDGDPRKNIKSLEADLCAIAQRWLSTKVYGDVRSIDQLIQEARKPKIKIQRLQTIDHLILRLREIRDTAIRAGGTRFISIEGDVKGGPALLIELNVTPQAMALKGKPPSLEVGSIYDSVRDGRGADRIGPMKFKASAENIEALREKLREAKDAGDMVTARKLRATLRKMGHKGGLRKKGGE